MSIGTSNTPSALQGALAAGAATTAESTTALRSVIRRFDGTEVDAATPLDPA